MLTFVTPGQPVHKVRYNGLPFLSLTFTSETTLIAAGHECTPVVFAFRNSTWTLIDKLDQLTSAKKTTSSSTNSAFNMFKQMDSKRQTTGNAAETKLTTLHQNTITEVRRYEGARENIHKLSTIGLDGQLIIWDLLEPSLKALNI
jgi:actin related protein 2/3 complex subunit 1A/1B